MTLHGLDASHWQTGLQLAKTGKDFAIMKATDGTSYVDSTCNGFVNQAKAAGMLWGTYHFWQAGQSPTAQADHYVDSIAGYVGHGLLVLDWESSDTGNVAGAKAWLDRVYARTGVRAVVYMSQSVAAGHDWSSVSKNYALWVARYNDTIGSTGGWPVTLWQYTSSGRVAGYSGPVDLDHFYGDRAAWTALAAGKDTSSGGGHDSSDDDGGDPMPEWKHKSTGHHHDHKADGEWTRLHLDDDNGVSLLAGPATVSGTLAVYVRAPKGPDGKIEEREVCLRACHDDVLPDDPDKTVVHSPIGEYRTHGGQTQLVLPFTERVAKPTTKGATARRLRFYILMYGGGTFTVEKVDVRATYWK